MVYSEQKHLLFGSSISSRHSDLVPQMLSRAALFIVLAQLFSDLDQTEGMAYGGNAEGEWKVDISK